MEKKLKYWLVLMLILGACTDKYVVHSSTPAAGYLVVEGFINIAGNTTISLTRSSGVDTPRRTPESGAAVEIQSQGGGSYSLTDAGNGLYTIENLNLDPSQSYRLHILTATGKEYQSTYSSAVLTPPIDEVNWTAVPGLVTINVSTHDNKIQPGYYQWQFEETWKYNSAFESILIYQDSQVQIRHLNDLCYYCYRSDFSTQIAAATTEKLTSNVIYRYPVQQVSYSTSNKLMIRYSILVKQYALSKEWYEWVVKIKKNTESTGSIFDAQPGETGGNFVCVSDPSELVIGYVGPVTETEKRIFIDHAEIPSGTIYRGYEGCNVDSIPIKDTALINDLFGSGLSVPISYFTEPGSGIPKYILGGSASCVDCRVAGGTTTPPPFWQ